MHDDSSSLVAKGSGTPPVPDQMIPGVSDYPAILEGLPRRTSGRYLRSVVEVERETNRIVDTIAWLCPGVVFTLPFERSVGRNLVRDSERSSGPLLSNAQLFSSKTSSRPRIGRYALCDAIRPRAE